MLLYQFFQSVNRNQQEQRQSKQQCNRPRGLHRIVLRRLTYADGLKRSAELLIGRYVGVTPLVHYDTVLKEYQSGIGAYYGLQRNLVTEQEAQIGPGIPFFDTTILVFKSRV